MEKREMLVRVCVFLCECLWRSCLSTRVHVEECALRAIPDTFARAYPIRGLLTDVRATIPMRVPSTQNVRARSHLLIDVDVLAACCLVNAIVVIFDIVAVVVAVGAQSPIRIFQLAS